MPNSDVVQVVVLGKGVGECILIALHPDEWIVVDSYREAGGQPAALTFLESVGINPAQAVVAVVLTHLHADHYDGIYDLLLACPNARFVMPAAVPEPHWGRVLQHLLTSEPPRARGLQQVANAFRLALDTGRFRSAAIDTYIESRHPELSVLAPLPAAQLAANAATSPAVATAARAVLRENYTSIVLWLRAGAASALLAADMDRHAVLGWQALLETHTTTRRIAPPASLVKVPHHASAHAHYAPVYQVLAQPGVAVLTPNRNSKLPDTSTVNDIKSRGYDVWQAGPLGAAPLRDFAVGSPATTVAVVATASRLHGSWTISAPPTARL